MSRSAPAGLERSSFPPAWTALVWLDWHLLRNRVRLIGRNPRRLLPWLLFLLWLVPSFLNRTLMISASRRTAALSLAVLAAPAAPFVPGAALVLLAVGMWRASQRAPAAFQSPADGRFLIGAGMPSRVILAWLSFRSARRLALAGAFYAVLLGFWLPGLGLPRSQVLLAAVGLVAYLWLLFGSRIALFTLQSRSRLPLGMVGVVLGGLGLASLAGAAGLLGSAGPLLVLLPPGSWLLGALRGDVVATALLAGLATALAVVGAAGAGDCLPELWAASTRTFELRRRMRRGGLGGLVGIGQSRPRRARPVSVAPAAEAWALPGAAVLAWKEWLAQRRARGGLQLQVALLAASIVAGTGAGLVTVERPQLLGLLLVYPVIGFVILGNLLTVRLAADLRTPVWWLAADPLWRRLTVLTVARAARLVLPLVVFGTLLVGLGSRQPWLAVIFDVLTVLLAWMVAALGLASYTLLPAATDRRVAQTIRVFVLYGALGLAAAGALPGAFAHSLPVALMGGALMLFLETGALLAFASYRLDGNGLAFAREERL